MSGTSALPNAELCWVGSFATCDGNKVLCDVVPNVPGEDPNALVVPEPDCANGLLPEWGCVSEVPKGLLPVPSAPVFVAFSCEDPLVVFPDPKRGCDTVLEA